MIRLLKNLLLGVTCLSMLLTPITSFARKPVSTDEFFSSVQSYEHCQGLLGILVEDSEIEGIVDIIPGAEIKEILPNSMASKAGLNKGDLITAFNGYPVESAEDLIYYVSHTHPYEQVTITITLVNSCGYYKTIDYTVVTVSELDLEEERKNNGRG